MDPTAELLRICRAPSAQPPVDEVRALLARGANPTAGGENGAWTALSAAFGVHRDVELARVLLEAGADPNDNDSLYHSVEVEDPEATRLLLEHGATVPGTNALAHALDYDRLERVELLLDAGADPDEDPAGPALHHAVRRGRSAEFLRRLAAGGAELARRDCRGRTAYQYAVRRARPDLADALVELGSPTETAPADHAPAAIAAGEPAELDDDGRDAVIDVALRDAETLGRVIDAVGPDFAGGDPRGTLLHYAAWRGRPELVDLLLARGADRDARAETAYATPLGWAAHGAQHAGEGDQRAAADRLLAAGAEVEPLVVDWLRDRE